MSDLINQLREPERHYPSNFDTVKRANAMLMCLCQESADALEAKDKEIAELTQMVADLESIRQIDVDEFNQLKALCDKMGAAIEGVLYRGNPYTGQINEALTAWRESK